MFKRLIKIVIIISVTFVSPSLFAISQEEARHLLTRTGFGTSQDEIVEYSKLSYEKAVDQILEQVNHELAVAPPTWLSEPMSFNRMQLKNASEEERKAFRKAHKLKAFEMKGWWLAEMVNTESPLTEKMVLFWHNHFTSSLMKVKQPRLLYQQNELFRSHALGNFKTLTHAICKDPAMLGYLDNFKSTKQAPNENFSRELLELFTLGEGNYTEQDIKEAARAFTGWSIDRNSGKFIFRKGRHDFGEKEFLGHRGNFDGQDIVEIIFHQAEIGELLINKLWLEFVSETPDKKEVARLVKNFRANNFEMKPLMREILMSKSFRNKDSYARLIKSPIDYIVGTLRILEIPIQDGRAAAFASAHLGLNVFDPPNVKGWTGGTDWITSSSLLTRQQLLERMFRGGVSNNKTDNMKLDRKLTMQKFFNKQNQQVDLHPFLERFSTKYSKQQVVDLLLVDKPVDSTIINKTAALNTEDLIVLMSDPVYQLK